MPEIKKFMELENFCYMEEIPVFRKKGVYDGVNSNNMEIQSQYKGSNIYVGIHAD